MFWCWGMEASFKIFNMHLNEMFLFSKTYHKQKYKPGTVLFATCVTEK